MWNSWWKLLQDNRACWKTQNLLFRNHAITTCILSVVFVQFRQGWTPISYNTSKGLFLQRDFRQELKVLFILEKSSVLGDGQLVCKGNEPTMVRRRAPSTPLVRGGTMAVVIERFKQWRCIMGVLLFPTIVFLWASLIQPIVHVLLALVVLLLYPKTFLWKGFLIHGRNPADDWFYIRNTQILWHHRPDRFLFTGTN